MKHTILSAACAGLLIAISATAQAAAISGQGTWESTLQGRDLDGNLATFEAYYDSVLDITWFANANYAATSGYDGDGHLLWNQAVAWADQLNINGYDQWRLPSVAPVNGVSFNYKVFSYDGSGDIGFNITSPNSEMAHMFYVTLGNPSEYSPTGVAGQCFASVDNCLDNTGPFANLLPGVYWSGTEYTLNTTAAFYFGMHMGWQTVTSKGNGFLAWAVSDGDVGVAPAAVPLPAAVWLFGSGLLGLLGVSAKRRG